MKRQNVLFPTADRVLRTLGENLRLARRRRKITAQMMAERANLSLMTLRAIERGSPSVAMSHGGAGTRPRSDLACDSPGAQRGAGAGAGSEPHRHHGLFGERTPDAHDVDEADLCSQAFSRPLIDKTIA